MRPSRPVAGVLAAASLGAAALAGACTPTVKLEAPDKPITINLNVDVKVSQEVRVRLDKPVEDLINQNSDVF